MSRSKQISAVLALSLVLASNFCFAECALASLFQPEATCAGKCHPEEKTEQDPTHLCCPPFVALEIPAASSVPEEISKLSIPSPVFINPATEPGAQGDLFLTTDPSPPQIFQFAHAIHAPPALL